MLPDCCPRLDSGVEKSFKAGALKAQAFGGSSNSYVWKSISVLGVDMGSSFTFWTASGGPNTARGGLARPGAVKFQTQALKTCILDERSCKNNSWILEKLKKM